MTAAVIGIDEAGRGACAGPLVSAAVLLSEEIEGLNDSKKLSHAKRVQLLSELQKSGARIGIGFVSHQDIDAYGLTWAQTESMRRALESVQRYEPNADIIIDGSVNYLKEYGATAVVKADSKYSSVMAAGIAAKVFRDRYIQALSGLLPVYGFDQHKGYATFAHKESIQTHGLSRYHRHSYNLRFT